MDGVFIITTAVGLQGARAGSGKVWIWHDAEEKGGKGAADGAGIGSVQAQAPGLCGQLP